MAQDLRSFLSLLEESHPKDILRVKREVSTRYEIAAVLEKLRKLGRSPAVYFTRVSGSPVPVVGNLLADRKKVALALGLDSEGLLSGLVERLGRSLHPIQVKTGPAQEVRESDVDLFRLPLLTHAEGDDAPSLSLAAGVLRDPESGEVLVGLLRAKVLGRASLGLLLEEASPLAVAVQRAKELDFALVIGMHPAFYLAASAEGLDGSLERVRPLGRIGAFLGEPLQVARAVTSDLPIPAHGEIIIEGVVAGMEKVKAPASPIGYEGRVLELPRMEVRAITHRADAIFQTAALFGELPFLPTPVWEAEALRPLKALVPAVRGLRLPPTGLGYHAYVQVEQRRMGEAKKAALAALSLLPRVKTAIAVDADIEPDNDREVLWALATRVVADRDIFMVPGVAGPPEDPTAYEITRRGPGGLVTKLGIDAATPLGLPYELPEPTRVPGTGDIRLEEYLEDW